MLREIRRKVRILQDQSDTPLVSWWWSNEVCRCWWCWRCCEVPMVLYEMVEGGLASGVVDDGSSSMKIKRKLGTPKPHTWMNASLWELYVVLICLQKDQFGKSATRFLPSPKVKTREREREGPFSMDDLVLFGQVSLNFKAHLPPGALRKGPGLLHSLLPRPSVARSCLLELHICQIATFSRKFESMHTTHVKCWTWNTIWTLEYSLLLPSWEQNRMKRS